MIKINYIIEKGNNIYINNKTHIQTNFRKYIETYLESQLTTFKGRVDAIKNKYGFHKLIPIYISHQLCFIPLNNLKDYELVYINIYEINLIQKVKNKTLIKFHDQSEIIINKQFNSIYNNYKRALIIKS